MRIRTIKPEFFTSLTIENLSLTAQRTFVGLWCYCDDYGRGLDDARLIKAAVWPLTDKHTASKVRKDLSEIAAAGLIVRYESQGQHLLQVSSWKEHQRVNRPSLSKYASLNDSSVKVHGALTDSSLGERNREEEQGTGKGKESPLPPHSGGQSKRDQTQNPRALGTNPRAVAALHKEETRAAQRDCDVCEGVGIIIGEDDLASPCPACRPLEVSA